MTFAVGVERSFAGQRWRRMAFAIGVGALGLADPVRAQTLALPCGSPVTADGRLGAEEWQNGLRVALPEGAALIGKVAKGNAVLAIELPRNSYRYLDIYVQDSMGRLLNLHASMMQGERLLGPDWSDSSPAFTWSPKGWESSIAARTKAPSDAPIEQQLKPLQGYELSVPIELLGPPPLRVRVEVRDFEGKQADWVYPAGSKRDDLGSWAELRSWARC